MTTHLNERPWQADDLIGGTLCLDLVNTAGGRGKARDVDRLSDMATALGWALLAGAIDPDEAASLGKAAADDAKAAHAALTELRAVREALHGGLAALAEGRPARQDDADVIEAAIKQAIALATLDAEASPVWRIERARCGLDLVRHRAALDALALLGSPDRGLLRACERCSWLFLDRSRSGRRRWCSPSVCGNRARAERHYHRRSAAARNP